MPRKARIKSSSHIYHVVIRGADKQQIFEEIHDYQKYLDIHKIMKRLPDDVAKEPSPIMHHLSCDSIISARSFPTEISACSPTISLLIPKVVPIEILP